MERFTFAQMDLLGDRSRSQRDAEDEERGEGKKRPWTLFVFFIGYFGVLYGLGRIELGRKQSGQYSKCILRTPTEFLLFAAMTCTLPDNT